MQLSEKKERTGHAAVDRRRGHHRDAEGRIEYLNPVAESLTLETREAADGRDRRVPDAGRIDPPAIASSILRCLRGGGPSSSPSVVLFNRVARRFDPGLAAPIRDAAGG